MLFKGYHKIWGENPHPIIQESTAKINDLYWLESPLKALEVMVLWIHFFSSTWNCTICIHLFLKFEHLGHAWWLKNGNCMLANTVKCAKIVVWLKICHIPPPMFADVCQSLVKFDRSHWGYSNLISCKFSQLYSKGKKNMFELALEMPYNGSPVIFLLTATAMIVMISPMQWQNWWRRSWTFGLKCHQFTLYLS